MNKIAQFHKVSFEQFKESWDDSFPGASEEEIKEIYDQIKLPKRATRGSAGYDFFSPVDFELKPGETIKIPTGIRVFIESDWVLNILQGIFMQYGVTIDDDATEVRNGGFGSTTK